MPKKDRTESVATVAKPSQTLMVGIDPHRATNMVCLLRSDGSEIGQRFRVGNNEPGMQQLSKRLNELAQTGEFEGVELLTEATNWYWLGMCYSLPPASQLPIQIRATFGPRLSANFKKALSVEDHTDTSDLFVLAKRLRMKRELPLPLILPPRSLRRISSILSEHNSCTRKPISLKLRLARGCQG